MPEEMLLDVVLSGEKPFWPDGKRLNVISSGEKPVCPDGKAVVGFRSQQKTPFGRTFPFLTKWFPPLSRGWHCPQGVLLARGSIGVIISQPEKHL